jgi:GNAT superfamily N-acetyltransferase
MQPSRSSLEIRPATAQEAGECRNIIQRAYEPGRRVMSRDPKVLLKSKEEFEALAKERRLYIILYERNVIGTFKLTLKERPAVLQSFALLPEFQNRGLGSMILMWIENFIRQNGFSTVQLETYEKWVRTNKFYQERGFFQVDSFVKEGEKILVWEKRLKAP